MQTKGESIIRKILSFYEKIGIYILSLGVILLNLSLAFDNVVWGDEAYSEMAIRNCTLYGIFEKTYYWDSHPPLYYYYLRFFADLFGYNTPVYHIASLLPFIIGIALACTLFKKQFGAIPVTFFILISGLSESCVEYNLEIRMYSLLFLFLLVCAYCSYQILKDGSKTAPWIILTVFGILSAYTHYYGLMTCGLLLFFTGLFHFIRTKGIGRIKGIVCVLVYIIVYIPWLFVLYFQTQAELNNAWMDKPEALNDVLRFICGGKHFYPIVFTYVVLMSIYLLVKESGHIRISKADMPRSFVVTYNKPSVKTLSIEVKAIALYWITGIALLAFTYGVSYLFHPIVTHRYGYVLTPLVLLIFILCMKKMFGFLLESTHKKVLLAFISGLFCLILLIGLVDFRYYRSVCKTQDFQTDLVLKIVGTPSEDAVLCSNGVQHLAWSVLSYYYPNNEVTIRNPNELDSSPSEIWAFIGYEFDDTVLNDMAAKGYAMDSYLNLWLGKYGINLYHFYR